MWFITSTFTGKKLKVQQNASQFGNPPLLFPTLYASPLITLTHKGYTKHYFEEGRRVCSKIGGGFRGRVPAEELETQVKVMEELSYRDQFHHQHVGVVETFGNCIGVRPELIVRYDILKMLMDYRGDEKDFFYHSDHLGSAAYLTTGGQVTQTLNYLPYGEDWVDIQNNLDPRLGQYTFNGKEKDYESGFHYYGARYYWSEVLTGWLSVDPMADKYPSISPYNYCVWNPIKLVDPDGEDPIYGKILLSVRRIGDDGKNDGKVYYVTGWKKISIIWATLWGRNYTGSLEASEENVFHVPTGNIANDVQTTITMVKQSGSCEHCVESQVEIGAHSMIGDDHAEIWDPGTPMESGKIDNNIFKRWSITPFMQNEEMMNVDFSDVEYVWHVQPESSIPSQADKRAAFDYTYNKGMKKATWFVVGARDGKVSFLSGLGKVHTIDIKDFQEMSRQQ